MKRQDAGTACLQSVQTKSVHSKYFPLLHFLSIYKKNILLLVPKTFTHFCIYSSICSGWTNMTVI